MEPVIDFVDPGEKPVKVEEPVSVPKKPVLIYKPTSFNPEQSKNLKNPNAFNIQIPKKLFKYLLLIIIILVIGLAGFLIGKFL